MPTPKPKRRASTPPAKRLRTENVNHPKGEGGTRIDAAKYEAMKKAILKAVPRNKQGVEFKALMKTIGDYLPGGRLPGGGALAWYLTTVKLDLEARGLIERIPGVSPQRLRRA